MDNMINVVNLETAKQSAAISEYLAFRLGDEEYGVDIQLVQELRGYGSVTRMANTPDFIKGVVNLRGVIVPIIDMRIKLNIGTATYDEFTVVVVLQIRNRAIGMVVDSVSDVINLPLAEIRPAPKLAGAIASDYLLGLGTIDDRMLILIDIEKLMAGSEIGLLERDAA